MDGRLADQRVTVVLGSKAQEWVAEKGYDPVFGARPLKRFLQRHLETRLARALIAGEVHPPLEGRRGLDRHVQREGRRAGAGPAYVGGLITHLPGPQTPQYTKVMKHWLCLGLVCTMSFGGRVVAQQIILTSASVIGGSATQDGSTFNTGQYVASKVTDEQSGAISLEDNSSTPLITYWLGPNTTNSAYFVIDLGASYTLAQISLFNTHNSGYADRGTNTFHVAASNSVFSAGAAGLDLVAATTILSGNLAFANPATEIFFTSGNGLSSGSNAYQYLRFTADTYYSQGSGLNEFRVFAAIPEPSTYAALAGLLAGAIALFAKRRR